jgi:hypothetical protein
VVALITVAGFLNGPGFAAMRAYLRREADAVWVIDLSPEGHQPDVATRVFPGVQQPVCITIAIRDGSTDRETPAPVHHRAIAGLQGEKFAQLGEVELGGAGWAECGTDWGAPFLPASTDAWGAMPALEDLMPWSGSGVMPGRTWVVAPSPDVLRSRWEQLIRATGEEKADLFQEHKVDRRVDRAIGDALPGFPVRPLPLAEESETPIDPIRIGYRTLDRQWIIPDKRLINRPNPSLWAVRSIHQVYLTAPHDLSPTAGPAATVSGLVPDLHHYHGRGGRVFPLWRDEFGTAPNIAPGLVGLLRERLGMEVAPEDLLAYIAGLLCHPGFTARFAADLTVPGLRVPVTADAALFAGAVALGRRVVWLHCHGERFVDAADDRPDGPPRLPESERPKVLRAIPDDPAGMPDEMDYSPADRFLAIGEGRIAPVAPEVWAYEVSGMNVLRKWFGYRKREPEGRRVSPLDRIVADRWEPSLTSELLDLLNVIGLLVALEPLQADLLARVIDGPLIDVESLTAAGVLPVPASARQAPKPSVQERPASLLD